MRIEHVAFNVAEPQKMAAWYVEHLGFTIKRAAGEPPYAHFLADDTGGVMIEIYHNAACEVPDYPQQNPLLLHLALVSHDIPVDVERLTAAGATVAERVKQTPTGDTMCMLPDPWGFPCNCVNARNR
ncbi:MAG: VOC family protein [Spirochaetaceae bacterium]